MMIEEGKFYKRADGAIAGPAQPFDSDCWLVGDAHYTRNGETLLQAWRLVNEVDFATEFRRGGQRFVMTTGIDFSRYVSETLKGSADQKYFGCVGYPAQKTSPSETDKLFYGDDPNRTTKKSVLESAIQTVADRGVPYGGVEDNFGRIAALWTTHLMNRYAGTLTDDPPKLDPSDVAMMMALMKIARLEANPSHADSWVDVAGYAACGGEIGANLPLTPAKPSGTVATDG